MEIKDARIDGGKPFDWGRTAADYARYRDIYPPEFYRAILDRGVGLAGQQVLDIGTGTGVLPRHLYKHGAHWLGVDPSPQQIAEARRLSTGMNIDYRVCAAEAVDAPNGSFNAITACQCYWYLDPPRAARRFARFLPTGGKVLLLVMNWLPFEDSIANASEQLVLRYNPSWSGAGEQEQPIVPNPAYNTDFTCTCQRTWRLQVPFTRESWHGRMRACRGVGASLTPGDLQSWEQEHRALLERIAPPQFTVTHYAVLTELTKK